MIKLWALLWKNGKFRKTHYMMTAIQILLPIIIFMVLSISHSKISGFKKKIVPQKEHSIYTLKEMYARINLDDFNLWYAPANNFTDHIVDRIVDILQIPATNLRPYLNQKQLLNGNPGKMSSICGVVFDTTNPKQLTYNIHMYTKDQSWDTNILYVNKYDKTDIKLDNSKYLNNGFIGIQMAINTAFMKMHGYPIEDFQFQVQQFPTPKHEDDEGMFVLFNKILPLLTIFSFMIQCVIVNQQILEEKGSGIKEYLKMVGVGPGIQFLALIISIFISVIISTSGIVFMIKVNVFNQESALIEKSNAFILFIFLVCYILVTSLICCTIASVCNNVNTSMSYGVMFLILSYFIPNFIKDYLQIPNKTIDSILLMFPNVILTCGYKEIFYFETQKTGIQWNNLFHSSNINQNNTSLGILLIIYLIELVCFSLLYIYLDNISPGQYGIAKSFDYPLRDFLKCIKCGIKKKTKKLRSSNKERLNLIKKKNIERPDNYLIEFQNVNKIYDGKVVVEDLNFAIAKNEITVLLGKNGAGKTTITSMMSGMIEASSGKIYISGKNIKKHTNEVRQTIGLCTQHNLLFNYLTVKEHLIFFSMVKINKNKNRKQEISDILKEIDLEDKANTKIDHLSGGMKRRLCLGISLIGNPKILVLDEPTSGVDLENRKHILNFLEKQKKHKTILITTHSLDDAEKIADRIAILDKSLLCYGTQKFINELYDNGYKLKIKYNTAKIINLIEYNLHLKFLIHRINATLTYKIILLQTSLKHSTATFLFPSKLKFKFPLIFEYFERNMDIIKITLSFSNLADIFYNNIGMVSNENIKNINQSEIDEEINVLLRNIKIEKKENNFILIFYKLFEKRCFHLISTLKYFIPQIFAMLFCFFIALALGKGVKYYYNDVQTLNLQLNVYNKPDIYYSISDIKELSKVYKNIVETQIGKLPIDSTPNLIETVLKIGDKNINYYNTNVLAGTDFEGNNCNYNITSYYSKDAIHSLPISVNLAMNAFFKKCLDENGEYGISASITPLLFDKMDNAPNALSEEEMYLYWATFIPIAVIIFTSVFMVFPFFEVSTKFTDIQFMSGISRPMYWIVNYIFDIFIATIVISLASTIFFWSFNLEEYGIMLTIFMTYVCCSLPITYIFGYFLNNLNSSIIRHIYIGIIIGIIPAFFMILIEKRIVNFEHINSIIRFVQLILNILPTFSLHHMSIKFAQTYVANHNWNILTKTRKVYLCTKEETKNPCCDEDSTECAIHKNYYLNEKNGLQYDLFASIFWFVVIVTITFLWMIFYKMRKTYICKCKGHERSETKEGVRDISYNIGKTNIVKDVSFDFEKHRCLGLIGANGSGKTSLIRILVNQIDQYKGTVKLDNLSQNDPKYLSSIGYCPQIDSLNLEISGENILKLLALVKGYNQSQANEITKSLIKLFDFEIHAKKLVKTYSGGTKRKLCTCLALLATPRLIILDEPTTGVDVVTTKAFQRILRKIITNFESEVILCSHSINEIEISCDRVAIMKPGQITKIITIEELQNQFKNKESGALYDYKVAVPHYVPAKELASTLAENGILMGKPYEEYIGKYCIPIASENKQSEMLKQINNINIDLIITSTTLKDAYIYVVQDQLENVVKAQETIVHITNEKQKKAETDLRLLAQIYDEYTHSHISTHKQSTKKRLPQQCSQPFETLKKERAYRGEESIKNELTDLGNSIMNVPCPQENNQDIYKLQLLMNVKTKVVPSNKVHPIIQCTRCQSYGHTETYCTRSNRCVNCTGDHNTLDCKNTKENEPTCGLCRREHPANYKNCTVYIENWKRRNQKSRTHLRTTPIPSHPTAIPTTFPTTTQSPGEIPQNRTTREVKRGPKVNSIAIPDGMCVTEFSSIS